MLAHAHSRDVRDVCHLGNFCGELWTFSSRLSRLDSLRSPSYRGADLFGAVLQISAVHPQRAEAWRRLQARSSKERKERKEIEFIVILV